MGGEGERKIEEKRWKEKGKILKRKGKEGEEKIRAEGGDEIEDRKKILNIQPQIFLKVRILSKVCSTVLL